MRVRLTQKTANVTLYTIRTMSSGSPRTRPTRETASGTRPSAPFLGTRRFALRRALGEGSMGAVYLVFDRQTGTEVALKTLRRVDASGIYRFKSEFRALADVNHPNLVKLHELFCENDEWFFTMEYVHGHDFLEHVVGPQLRRGDRTPRPTREVDLDACGEPLDPTEQVRSLELLFPSPLRDLQRLRDVMQQIASGLLAVHAAGKLHRDLKSDNVLVTPDGRAVLLDFGIAAERSGQLHKTLDAGVMGTPAYMSPEQAEGRAVDEGTDWYSLGVMLYEALTGAVPFDGTYLQIIQQKQHFDPLPPSQVVSGVPTDLDELCMQLLARDPSARPRGAAVLRALAGKRAASTPPPRPSVSPELIPTLVGRKTQLEALDQALAATDANHPVLVLVHGDSGMGKTVLVESFLAGLRTRGETVVLKGACYERESVPFKAFDSLIDTLSRYLRRLSPVRAAELIPRDVQALAQLFPVLRRVDVIKEARRRTPLPTDPQELRRRAFVALKEMFSRIADRHPLVLFIDDLQWGDVDSARLIADLLQGPDSPALLCVGTYRSGEVAGSSCLQTLLMHTRDGAQADLRQLAVGALAPEECNELARELLGQDAWPCARAIGSESQGSPFLLTELVSYVQKRRELDGRLPELVSLEVALAERFETLSTAACLLLELVSVAARPVPEHMLSLAATFDIDLPTALSELRGLRLLRGVAQRSVRAVDVYHDRIRRAVLARLSDEALVLWHRRLATTLEASGSKDLEALTRHLLGARAFMRASLYARRAAEQARGALAFDKAAELYAVAAEHSVGDAAERSELLAAWGEALVNAGRAARAADVFFEAAALAPVDAALMLRRKAGVELLRGGYYARGVDALHETLGQWQLTLPASFRESFGQARVLRDTLRQRGFVFARRAEHEVPRDQIERLDTVFSITLGLLLTEVDRTLPLVVRIVLHALDAGEPARIACALCLFHVYVDGGMATVLGDKALGALELAQTLAARTDDARARAWVLFARGHESMRRGELTQATLKLAQAEEAFRTRCAASAAEMRLCRQLLASLVVYGSGLDGGERCEEWVREAEDHGDIASAIRLRLLATGHSLAQDAPERVERYCAEAETRPDFDLTGFARQVSRSQVDLYRADAAACRADIDGFDGFFTSALASVPLWSAQCHVLRAQLAVCASALAVEAERDLLLGRADTEIGLAEKLGLRCFLPHIQLLRAAVAAGRSEPELALRWLDALLDASETRRELPVVAACARLRKGELLGGHAGALLVEQADADLRARGVRNPAVFSGLYAPLGVQA